MAKTKNNNKVQEFSWKSNLRALAWGLLIANNVHGHFSSFDDINFIWDDAINFCLDNR